MEENQKKRQKPSCHNHHYLFGLALTIVWIEPGYAQGLADMA